MTVYDMIREAVLNKRQVFATYQGHERLLSPHVLGRKNGRGQCLFFQFGGTSGSGLPAEGEWRCLPIEGLSNVAVTDGEWHSGATHSRPQTCVGEVDVVAP